MTKAHRVVAPRAWLTKEKKMVKVVTINYLREEITHDEERHAGFAATDFFPDITILRATGLTDCKGVMIFEGDVISIGDKGQVMFGKSKPVYGWYTVGFFIKWINGFETNLFPALDKAGQIEVLGNIYESPGLLTRRPDEGGEGE